MSAPRSDFAQAGLLDDEGTFVSTGRATDAAGRRLTYNEILAGERVGDFSVRRVPQGRNTLIFVKREK